MYFLNSRDEATIGNVLVKYYSNSPVFTLEIQPSQLLNSGHIMNQFLLGKTLGIKLSAHNRRMIKSKNKQPHHHNTTAIQNGSFKTRNGFNIVYVKFGKEGIYSVTKLVPTQFKYKIK